MTGKTAENVRRQTARMVRMAAVVSALIALPMLTGCGEGARTGDAGGSEAGDRRPAAERGTEDRRDEDRTTGKESETAQRSEDGEAGAGEAGAGGGAQARAGNAVADAGGGADDTPGTNVAQKAATKDRDLTDASREVVLKVRGDEGKFTGVCFVGDEKRRIGGRTPERYAFSPGGEKLRCEIRGEGPGPLNVVLAAGDDVRSVQQSGAGESRVNLTYAGDRISIYQSSSGTGSQVQSTSISDATSRVFSSP